MTSDPFTEGAKATGEVAKLGQKGLETAEKAGKFAERHFGQTIKNIAAISNDWTGYLRAKNFVAIMDRYERLQKSKGGAKHLGNIPPRQFLPLLSSLTEEDDETLQEIWARYLLSGSTDSGVGTLTRTMTDLIRKLEPDDVKIINYISALGPEKIRKDVKNHDATFIMAETDLNLDQIYSSLSRLGYLGLLVFEPNQSGPILLADSSSDGSALSVSIDTLLGSFRPTPMFLQFTGTVGLSNHDGRTLAD